MYIMYMYIIICMYTYTYVILICFQHVDKQCLRKHILYVSIQNTETQFNQCIQESRHCLCYLFTILINVNLFQKQILR